MTSRVAEWVAFAVGVVGVVLYQSDVHVALRVVGTLCIFVGVLGELWLTGRGYLRKRAEKRSS